MLNNDGHNNWEIILGLVVATLLARVIYNLAYVNDDRYLGSVGLLPERKCNYYQGYDEFLAPLPFLWCWLDIFAALFIGDYFQHPAIFLGLAVWVAGRMRALQEIGHIAVHYGLCRSQSWQSILGNVFFQYPIFKRSFKSRRVVHVKEHHRNPNVAGKDPNIQRIIAAGLVPGISASTFYKKILFPLSVKGIGLTFKAIWDGISESDTITARLVRLVVTFGLMSVFAYVGGWESLFWLYIVPLILFYPLFSWVSLMTEHRWFAEMDFTNRVMMECSACRPTEFRGVSGFVLKQIIFPYSDHYHLAHSLYPILRWNHLPAVDRELRLHEPAYAKHASHGLLFTSGSIPSALSELKQRLTADSKTRPETEPDMSDDNLEKGL